MGNRGNVIFVAGEVISPCIYLHWNGGPESIYAFLAELDRRDVRADGEYEAARFVQIVGEFFSHEEWDAGLCLGITSTTLSEITAESLSMVHTDQSDNGFYVVQRGLKADGTLPDGTERFGLSAAESPLRVRSVRRFVDDYPGGLREMSPEEASLEFLEASQHAYAASFREMYAQIQAGRTAPAEATAEL